MRSVVPADRCRKCKGTRVMPDGHGQAITCKYCNAHKETKPMPFMDLNENNPDVQRPLLDALKAVKSCGPSREFSIVRTKIEEAILWLKAAERAEFTEHAK